MGQIRYESLLRVFELIDDRIDARFADWCKWRRHLHAHPELSWHEKETTRFIKERLAESGLNLIPGPRQLGGFVDFDKHATDGMVAIRGDIDAIPVTEETGLAFSSKNKGVMHACGHDVHTTVVLAVCETLKQLVDHQIVAPLKARAIFQPAEEVAQGATETIAVGALQGVEKIVAMHVDPGQQVGQFGFLDGVQTACCDEVVVEFSGPGGHGARPHEAADPVYAAVQFINTAYASLPRLTDARRSHVLSFCNIQGGHSSNVIPTEVIIRGTLRSFDQETRSLVLENLASQAEMTAKSTGVVVKYEPGVGIPSVNNCAETNAGLRTIAQTLVGAENVCQVEPSLGGEDFACYQALIPGALVRIGTAKGDFGSAHLHSPHFDVDEEVIRIACRLFCRSILQSSGMV